jgi:hypothetical protein
MPQSEEYLPRKPETLSSLAWANGTFLFLSFQLCGKPQEEDHGPVQSGQKDKNLAQK